MQGRLNRRSTRGPVPGSLEGERYDYFTAPYDLRGGYEVDGVGGLHQACVLGLLKLRKYLGVTPPDCGSSVPQGLGEQQTVETCQHVRREGEEGCGVRP